MAGGHGARRALHQIGNIFHQVEKSGRAIGSKVGGAVGGETGSAIGGALGAAAGQAGEALTQFAQKVMQMIQALSPAAAEQFQQAMQDLNATLGQAFLPAFQVVTQMFRDMASVINPLVQQLAPIFQQLAQALAGLAIAGLRMQVAIGTALLPLLTALADIVQQLTIPLSALYGLVGAIVSALINVVTALGGFELLKSVIKSITDGLQSAVKALVLFTYRLALTLNWKKLQEGIEKAFAPVEPGGVKAAGPTAIKGLEQIGKDLATASFQAGPLGGAEDPQAKFNRELLKELGDIKANGDDFKPWLERQLRELAINMAKGTAQSLDPTSPLQEGQSRTAWGVVADIALPILPIVRGIRELFGG